MGPRQKSKRHANTSAESTQTTNYRTKKGRAANLEKKNVPARKKNYVRAANLGKTRFARKTNYQIMSEQQLLKKTALRGNKNYVRAANL